MSGSARLSQRWSHRGSRVLLLGVLGLAACNERFEFDIPATTSTEASATTAGETTGLLATSATTDAGGAPEGSDLCQADNPCQARGFHCLPETGQCVACLGDSDCDGQYAYCSLALHRCVECTDDQQCGTGRVCEPISHRCATSCRYSDDCGDDDHACDDGHCVVCDRDPECDESNARLCAAGGLACVNCRVDMECAVGRCDSLRGECVQCLTSADCETGLCNPVTLVCVGP